MFESKGKQYFWANTVSKLLLPDMTVVMVTRSFSNFQEYFTGKP